LDNELAQLKRLLNAYTVSEEGTEEMHEISSKLIPLLSKANFFVESISPAAIQLWFYALSYNEIPIGGMMQDFSSTNELVN
jgi:hypothetical protein